MYERKQRLKAMDLTKNSQPAGNTVPDEIPVIHARKTILIADDIEMNRELMGDFLEEDYEILYASDGIETLEVLRSHKDEVDLVLLDLQMPNKNGREVIAEMQIDEDLMSVPVIFLTVDQEAELDCLKSGAMDFIPKPYPDIDIVKARIAKCIELSEDRELIRFTERDKLTGLLNKDYFYRYVGRLDHLYKDDVLDAVACDVNRFHAANKQYGRQFCDQVLRCIGSGIKKLARETGGIVCRETGDTFLLYCPHQDDYEMRFRSFMSGVFADTEMAEKVSMRFGVFTNALQEPNIEERFECAKIAADRVKDDPQKVFEFY
jgi:diguanylate cyclase (GGDEF)-like protein